MPWKEVRPMDQKVHFISDWLRGGHSFSALCRFYGISRKTGYKWIHRFETLGAEGLDEKSRRPGHSPQQTPHVIRQEIIRLRRSISRDAPGAKKIRSMLMIAHPGWDIPSATTIYNILRREGLVETRKPRRRVARMTQPFKPVTGPNQVWSADFKGQFMTADSQWCYPLTVMDHTSRFLLECRGFEGTRLEPTKASFTKLFQQHGLPERIRTDNGVPFATTSTAGLSRLSVWWIRLGILPERIEPGKPQQNGRHERMHRTLKKATTKPPSRSAKAQQRRFDEFRKRYNFERPHESLGQTTPASHYRPSPRAMPKRLPQIEYPGHFRVERASGGGVICCDGMTIYVGHILTGELVGMEEIDNGIWDVYFGPVRIGGYDERTARKKRRSPNGYTTIKV